MYGPRAGEMSRSAQVDADVDKYTAAIDVSNACRMFYVSRLQTAETLKDRLVDRRRAVRAAAAPSPPPHDQGTRHAVPGGSAQGHRRSVVDEVAALEAVVARLHTELVSPPAVHTYITAFIEKNKHTSVKAVVRALTNTGDCGVILVPAGFLAFAILWVVIIQTFS